jgi:hypothetical protein
MKETDLRTTLLHLDPAAMSDLRRLLYADQADRDRLAEQLLRRRTEGAADLANEDSPKNPILVAVDQSISHGAPNRST